MSYSGSAGGGIGGVSPASTPQVAAVPGTKILLCKSGVKDKKPDPAGADYGELFVNYHSGSPMLCFKDNAGEIVEIKPTRNIDGGGGETPPSTGNEIGDTLWDGTHFRVWDGSTWVAIGPNDLAYVQKVDGGTITNSAGSDVDIPVVNNIQAGLMLPADKNKLDTYPADAADLEVDLGYTAAADKGTVTNTNGDDAEIPLANGTNAGLMAPGDKNKIDGYPATPGDLAATLDLQAVTDNGNTTTNGATFGDGNISLNANGSGSFATNVQVGGDPTDGGENGTKLWNGNINVSRSQATGVVFEGFTTGITNPTFKILANGNANFSGDVQVGGNPYTSGGAAKGVRISPSLGRISISSPSGGGSGLDIKEEGDTSGTPAIALLPDGSASFAGDLTAPIFKSGDDLVLCADYDNNGSASSIKFCIDGDDTTNGVDEQMRLENGGKLYLGIGSPASVASPRIFLDGADGSGSFAGYVYIADNPGEADKAGIRLYKEGAISLSRGTDETGRVFGILDKAGYPTTEIFPNGSGNFAARVQCGGDANSGGAAGTQLNPGGTIQAARATGQLFAGFTVGTNTPTSEINANGSASFAGEVTADTFKYSGSAPSPALAGKEIDLVATLHLMAAKLAELGGVDVASLFVANDPAPVTQPAEPADDEGASSESSY